MNIFVCCLLAGIFSFSFADIKYEGNYIEKENFEKSSESKHKRDASFLLGSYYGPSYKYLPPSSGSSSDLYMGSLRPQSGISGIYNSGNNGFSHKSGHFGSLTNGNQNSGIVTTHSTGHGFVPQLSGTKGKDGLLNFGSLDLSSGRINTNPLGHRNNGFQPNSLFLIGGHLGQSASSGNRYYHPKVLSGSFPSSATSGLRFDNTLHSSQGVDLTEDHHGEHVHNGGQEHLYIVSSGSSNFDGSHQGVIELPSVSYLTPVRQHPLPSSSYEVPIENVGNTYKQKFNQYASGIQAPTYAAGHKGLGHFSFTSNKPQVLHTSVSGLSFKQPSSSKAPFKPSTFLGAKYEETSKDSFVSQQRIPTTLVHDITGYDYPILPESSVIYQQENNAQSSEVPNSTYQINNSNENSLKEITSPSGHYLPPENNYEGPNSY